MSDQAAMIEDTTCNDSVGVWPGHITCRLPGTPQHLPSVIRPVLALDIFIELAKCMRDADQGPPTDLVKGVARRTDFSIHLGLATDAKQRAGE